MTWEAADLGVPLVRGTSSWCGSAGLVSQSLSREDVLLSKGSGLSRSERRRNARKERLRALVPRGGAVIGIDLGGEKQALAVVDHDVRVLWRKTARVRAHELGEALDLAVAAARERGLARVTVACEPTGPRWMQVQRLCAERGLTLV